MASYRLTGIVRAQREVFRFYYDHPQAASRNRLMRHWEHQLKEIAAFFQRKQIPENALNLNSRCALFNLRGLVSLHYQGSHPYVQHYRSVDRIIQEQFSGRKPLLVLQFSPSRRLRHRIRLHNGQLHLHPSIQALELPADYLPAIAEYLILRLKKKSLPLELKQKISRFEKPYSQALSEEPPWRVSPIQLQPQGRCYNLESLFHELNREYFQETLSLPHLGWTQRYSRRRLGFYDAQRRLLNISRILDHPSVPRFVLEGILYHEMLHMVYPTQIQNGRRIMHGPEFKKAEKKFRYYKELKNWLKNEFPLLPDQVRKRKRFRR